MRQRLAQCDTLGGRAKTLAASPLPNIAEVAAMPVARSYSIDPREAV